MMLSIFRQVTARHDVRAVYASLASDLVARFEGVNDARGSLYARVADRFMYAYGRTVAISNVAQQRYRISEEAYSARGEELLEADEATYHVLRA